MLGVVFNPSLNAALVACVNALQLFTSIICVSAEEVLLKNKTFPDIGRLSKLEHGTELVFIENSFNEKRAYHLEDFFWTGSGDGNTDDWVSENPSTVFETKTILTTIYLTAPSIYANQTTQTKCSFNCESPLTPDGEISPTPTYGGYENSTEEDYMTEPDRQFWLLTVLKSRGKDPVINDLRNSLEKLYRTAFQRQQERHLGIHTRNKRSSETTEKSVNVYIHNVSKAPINGNEKIDVLYHVAVSGQPVSATTAAADMHLVSDEEVTNELGYPFIIKAEPYLKVGDPQYLASSNNTWVFIGVALTILFTLLLLVALLTLAMSKRAKKSKEDLSARRDIGINHHDSFISHDAEKGNNQSPTYINFRSQPSNCTLKSGAVNRPSSTSSSSSFSISSLDLTPLMRERHQHHEKHQHALARSVIPRPRAAINKTAPIRHESRVNVALDSDSSSDQPRQSSAETILIKNYDPGVVSPKSYLSMPSVKSFPRGSIPEPLNKVLEPVSVLHLDIIDDEVDQKAFKRSAFIRHGSLNAVEDPGVIGPVVWDQHCQRLQHGVSVDEGINDAKIINNATRMRKRFHDLLDDTFSLFGSQRETPVDMEDGKRAIPVEIKSRSAVTNRTSEDNEQNLHPRPKTSGPIRPPLPGSEPPRSAWYSKTGSPLLRPLSAGVPHKPQVDVNRILATGTLPPNDPAIPLIAAIKDELGKCSLPGSTSDLRR